MFHWWTRTVNPPEADWKLLNCCCICRLISQYWIECSFFKRSENTLLDPQANGIKVLTMATWEPQLAFLGAVSKCFLTSSSPFSTISWTTSSKLENVLFSAYIKKYMILNNFLISMRFCCFVCLSHLSFLCLSWRITLPSAWLCFSASTLAFAILCHAEASCAFILSSAFFQLDTGKEIQVPCVCSALPWHPCKYGNSIDTSHWSQSCNLSTSISFASVAGTSAFSP